MSLALSQASQHSNGQLHFWAASEARFPTEQHLVRATLELGAEDVGPWSESERALARSAGCAALPKTELEDMRDLIRSGRDPLGDAFCTLRSPVERRKSGATYTPAPIIRAMVDWAATHAMPQRIVEPGVGAARFLLDAGRVFPNAELVGVDTDPVATLIARANLATAGFSNRSRIILEDYRRFEEASKGRTLYIGNPPYVRHHQIETEWKHWLFREASALGLKASKLAGLHVHFLLAMARTAKPGDFGALITAAEWLDVNYGALVRALLTGQLGGRAITVIEPTAQPFPDAATTAAITAFELSSKPTSVFFQRVTNLKDLGPLEKGRRIRRERLVTEHRWSHLSRSTERPPDGYVELGELCRVHRGQVTGSNAVWIAGSHTPLLPECVLFPTVTRAREVFDAGGLLHDASRLRSVIDLPVDLDTLGAAERAAVERFLRMAREMGANNGYIARHRKAWWSVGLREPAPIISTYMARRAPAFALNRADARHINIAHGLYPRDPLSLLAQQSLVSYLSENISRHSGRTYAGGLTKFEPREMERLTVPGPQMLAAGVVQ